MENGPFIDDFPINTSIYKGFAMAMWNNQMVRVCLNIGQLQIMGYHHVPTFFHRILGVSPYLPTIFGCVWKQDNYELSQIHCEIFPQVIFRASTAHNMPLKTLILFISVFFRKKQMFFHRSRPFFRMSLWFSVFNSKFFQVFNFSASFPVVISTKTCLLVVHFITYQHKRFLYRSISNNIMIWYDISYKFPIIFKKWLHMIPGFSILSTTIPLRRTSLGWARHVLLHQGGGVFVDSILLLL